jgi:hypothetical protein
MTTTRHLSFTAEQAEMVRNGFFVSTPDDETLASGELGFTRDTVNTLADKLRSSDGPLEIDVDAIEAFALKGMFQVTYEDDFNELPISDAEYDAIITILNGWDQIAEYRVECMNDAGEWHIIRSERTSDRAVAHCRKYQREFPGNAYRVRDSEGRMIP